MSANTDEVEMIKRTIRETVNILAKALSHIEDLSIYTEKVKSMTCKDPYQPINLIMNRLALDLTVSLATIRRVSYNLSQIYGTLEVTTNKSGD